LLAGVVQCSAKAHLGAPGGPRVGHPARELCEAKTEDIS
jgi:hypothetical protein